MIFGLLSKIMKKYPYYQNKKSWEFKIERGRSASEEL